MKNWMRFQWLQFVICEDMQVLVVVILSILKFSDSVTVKYELAKEFDRFHDSVLKIPR